MRIKVGDLIELKAKPTRESWNHFMLVIDIITDSACVLSPKTGRKMWVGKDRIKKVQ